MILSVVMRSWKNSPLRRVEWNFPGAFSMTQFEHVCSCGSNVLPAGSNLPGIRLSRKPARFMITLFSHSAVSHASVDCTTGWVRMPTPMVSSIIGLLINKTRESSAIFEDGHHGK